MPLVTLILVALNLGVYALELSSDGSAVCSTYGLVPRAFMHEGGVGALATHLFLHDPGSLFHLAGNMAFLAVFGALVEGALGGLPFLALYLAAGVAGGLLHVLVDPTGAAPLVGASGAIFGILAVAGALRPRLLGFVVAFVGLNVWNAFNGDSSGVSFGAHLGGFCVGVLVVALMRVAGNEALEAT